MDDAPGDAPRVNRQVEQDNDYQNMRDDDDFNAVIEGLRRGDFSRLAPFFDSGDAPGVRCRIVDWYEHGSFARFPDEAAEALTCACFLGRTEVADYLITKGLDPSGGSKTGMNAVHWAANRGQVEALKRLLRHGVPLEVRNMYGGTVLGQAVWSAVNQPRPGQIEAIAELVRAGADVTAVTIPTGNSRVDDVLLGRKLR